MTFVTQDDRDADDACSDLDGKDLLGARVRVEMARERGRGGNPPGKKTPYRIIVENLSSRTSRQDLKDYFRAAGEISYTNAHNQRQGEGLVEFAERRGMEYALEKLDDTELNGRRLKLVEESKMFGGEAKTQAELSAALEKREEKLKKKERALEEQQTAHERAEAELETARKEMASLQALNRRLEAALSKKDKQIAELNDEISAAAVRRSNNTEDSDVYGGSSGGEGAYRLV